MMRTTCAFDGKEIEGTPVRVCATTNNPHEHVIFEAFLCEEHAHKIQDLLVATPVLRTNVDAERCSLLTPMHCSKCGT